MSEDGKPERFIPPELDQARLDKTVKQHFAIPWSKARDAIESGKIFLNGNAVDRLDHLVAKGDRIELRLSVPRKPSAPTLDPTAVIYCDNHIVVVNKPAGLLSVPHPQAPDEPSLDRLTLAYLRKAEPESRRNQTSLGVAQRIDKETSGLIVFARSGLALKSLTGQFRAHSVERRYLALAHGHVKSQTIRSNLLRNTGEGQRGSMDTARSGKPKPFEDLGRLAITHVSVEQLLKNASLVSCRLETGRTHQIRIHLSEIGHPLLGEKVYIRNFHDTPIFAPRVMLHATELAIQHPATGQRMAWTQAPPKDFEDKLNALQ